MAESGVKGRRRADSEGTAKRQIVAPAEPVKKAARRAQIVRSTSSVRSRTTPAPDGDTEATMMPDAAQDIDELTAVWHDLEEFDGGFVGARMR